MVKNNDFVWQEKCLIVNEYSNIQTQRQFFFWHYYHDFFKQIAGPRQEIVEIGCGRCTIGQYFARDGKNIECVDIEPSAVALAEKNFNSAGLSGRFLQADATHLPYGRYDRKFRDCVISVGLIEHLQGKEWQKVFSEAYRLLRPGGILAMVNVPKKFSIQTFFQKHDHYHRETLTPEDYVKAAKEAGFDIVRYVYVNPFPLLETKHERLVTLVFKFIYWLRSWFTKQPMAGSKRWSQAHLLICLK